METRFNVNQIPFTFTSLINCKSINMVSVNGNCKSDKLWGNFIKIIKMYWFSHLHSFTFTLYYIIFFNYIIYSDLCLF